MSSTNRKPSPILIGIALVALALSALPPFVVILRAAAPTIVQSATKQLSGTTDSLSFSGTPTAGNLIAVYVGSIVNQDALVTADNQGNGNYTRNVNDPHDSLNANWFTDIAATSSGTFTVTFDNGAVSMASFAVILEIAGAPASSYVESATLEPEGEDTTPRVVMANTTAAETLVLGGVTMAAVGTVAPDTSLHAWATVQEQESSSPRGSVIFFRTTANGDYEPDWNLSASMFWKAASLVIVAAGGGGGSTCTGGIMLLGAGKCDF